MKVFNYVWFEAYLKKECKVKVKENLCNACYTMSYEGPLNEVSLYISVFFYFSDV